MSRLLVLILLLTFSTACSFYYDLDSVEIDPAEDAGADAQADAAPDLGAESACSILDSTGCQEGESCVFEQETGELLCASVGFAGGAAGSMCEVDGDCSAELRCVEWFAPDNRGSVCSTPCSTESGAGCGLGEFCSRTAGTFPDDLGFCTRQCDLLDPTTCAPTELCVPDPYFSGPGFPSSARCLENAPGERGALGADCDPVRLDEAGCDESLTCLTVSFGGTVGSYCLQPCELLSDCSSQINYQSCESIAGSSSVGYCSP